MPNFPIAGDGFLTMLHLCGEDWPWKQIRSWKRTKNGQVSVCSEDSGSFKVGFAPAAQESALTLEE